MSKDEPKVVHVETTEDEKKWFRGHEATVVMDNGDTASAKGDSKELAISNAVGKATGKLRWW